MAAAFKMTNKAILERIKQLENSGFIKGVLDDRGKYILLTDEEIEVGLSAIIENDRKKGKTDSFGDD